MPCINKHNLLYVKTYSLHDKEVVKISPNVGYYAKENAPYDFFYIQFSNADSFRMFPINKIVPEEILVKIRKKEVFLMLDNALEHFLECAEAIYKDIVMAHTIPAEQIIFLSAVPTMNLHVAKLAKRLQLPEIKVDWFSLFEATGRDAAQRSEAALPKKKRYTKKFINLNRRWRLHRPFLITLLKSKKLLEYGYISFAPSDDGKNWNTVYTQLQNVFKDNSRLSNLFKENEDVKTLPPFYLDTEDLVTNRAIHESTINNYYTETYFSIVNETTYFEGTPFLSEKIFKTIGMGHPFIMVTAPNSLQYLKKLGYKTYEPLINESYDNILDNGERMLAILDEVERLCNMPENILRKQWLPAVREIANHNRKLILSRWKKDQYLSQPMNY